MTLMSAGHEMEAVVRDKGKGVSFEKLSKLFTLGVQATDTIEALGATLDKHISKPEAAAPAAAPSVTEEAAPADASQPGAQV